MKRVNRYASRNGDVKFTGRTQSRGVCAGIASFEWNNQRMESRSKGMLVGAYGQKGHCIPLCQCCGTATIQIAGVAPEDVAIVVHQIELSLVLLWHLIELTSLVSTFKPPWSHASLSIVSSQRAHVVRESSWAEKD